MSTTVQPMSLQDALTYLAKSEARTAANVDQLSQEFRRLHSEVERLNQEIRIQRRRAIRFWIVVAIAVVLGGIVVAMTMGIASSTSRTSSTAAPVQQPPTVSKADRDAELARELEQKRVNMALGYIDFAKNMAMAGNVEAARDFLTKGKNELTKIKSMEPHARAQEVEALIEQRRDEVTADKVLADARALYSKGELVKAITLLIDARQLKARKEERMKFEIEIQDDLIKQHQRNQKTNPAPKKSAGEADPFN